MGLSGLPLVEKEKFFPFEISQLDQDLINRSKNPQVLLCAHGGPKVKLRRKEVIKTGNLCTFWTKRQ